MIKRILFAVFLLCVVGGGLAGVKYLQIAKMVAQGAAVTMPPVTVSTAEVSQATWESLLSAVGSVITVQGVSVTAETPGKVVRIGFESGGKVVAGDVLVWQDVSEETARVRALEASEQLARINLKRMNTLVAQRSVAVADYDKALAEHKQVVAEMDALKAQIAKKTIRAPFRGTLGLRQVNLGQHLNESNPIVSLQRLDSVYVDFFLPQHQAAQVQPGWTVHVQADVLNGTVEGQVHALEVQAEAGTRTVHLRALIPNTQEILRPGMFVSVEVVMPQTEDVLLIPVTAVLYAPYSDSVFVVESASSGNSTAGLVLRQQLITLGERRGDLVVVKKGLQPSQTVVSAGVFKLRNGQAAVIDNSLSPQFSIDPKPSNS